VRLGLVGAGEVARLHAEAASNLPGVTIAAVCDPRPVADRFGVRAFSDHRAMFEAGGLDGVIVTAPHTLHAPITVDAARHGLHVLVEKPMATTVNDCLLMQDACSRYGVRLAVGHVVHFLPALRQAREIIASGNIGSPVMIAERRTARYDPATRPGWFFDPALAGGGIVMNVGIHSIDKAQWLAASPAVQVLGYVVQKPELQVETEALALLRLANDVRVSLSLAGTGLPFHDETEVVCTEGALTLSRTNGLWIHREHDSRQLSAASEADLTIAFRDQLADFVAACNDDREPEVGGDYGRSVVQTAVGIYTSARLDERVAVGELARA